MRFTNCGFSGVRCKVTTQQKELAILSRQLRALSRKLDETSVLADRLAASQVFQRRILVAMVADMSTVVSNMADNRQDLTAPVASTAADATAAAAMSSMPVEAPIVMDERDAEWVLDLKVIGPSSMNSMPLFVGRLV